MPVSMNNEDDAGEEEDAINGDGDGETEAGNWGLPALSTFFA